MKKDEIRKLIIKKLRSVRALLLTNREIKLMKMIIRKGSITSSELSKIHGMSVNNASTKLKSFHSKGYLKREQIDSESGGIEYIYKRRI